MIEKIVSIDRFVAVTDLFPLANQAIRPHTDQSGAEHIDSFFLSRTIFSSLFWKSRQVREHPASSEDRPLSCSLLRTFPDGRSSLKSTLLLATHTEEPALRPVTQATYYSDTPPTNSRTNILTGDTKKKLFSL